MLPKSSLFATSAMRSDSCAVLGNVLFLPFTKVGEAVMLVVRPEMAEMTVLFISLFIPMVEKQHQEKCFLRAGLRTVN